MRSQQSFCQADLMDRQYLGKRCIGMKLGIIRCMQTEDACPGTTDFRMVQERAGAFEGVQGELELIGFVSCGGCPGKKAVFRALELVRRGADAIAFASCIKNGNPIGYPCPFTTLMREAVKAAVGPEVQIFEYTH